MKYPSIFNDVIGPVMRGPSASHCAASVRIGRIVRDLMSDNISHVIIEFDKKGSLAHTHKTHGSDIGLFAGFLGMDVTDKRLAESERILKESGISVEIKISGFKAEHPNTYKIIAENSSGQHQITAVSTGGGMIEVIEIDGVPISIEGDYFETLVFPDFSSEIILKYLKKNIEADEIILLNGKQSQIIEIKGKSFLDQNLFKELKNQFAVKDIKSISPVLPVLSGKEINVPFITCTEMLEYNKDKKMELWELAVDYECKRGNFSEEKVFNMMAEIVDVIQNSIHDGIKGTEYSDRILKAQAGLYAEHLKNKKLLDAGILNQIILSVTSLMDVKSSMGVIVAAPTAGSCGALPGTCMGAANSMNLAKEEIIKAMLSAGLIGIFITVRSTFAAEVCGCQAECGAGSGMAAAALVTLAGGNLNQAIAAASMALQNILGMICDPVANRVEVPCLGKNIMAASNALSCANMALAGFDPVIPLDEVIQTMDEVGKSIPYNLRCTALGGLSITKTSKEIEKRLSER